MVECIVLRFICFLACAPIVFKFLVLGLQILDLALDLMSRFIFELDGGIYALFLLVEVF